MKSLTRIICFNAIISALYVALTLLLAPISYGIVQLRVAESLTILPCIMPYSIWGLFIGCILSNLASPFGIYDILLGSLITLLAGYLTSLIKNKWLAPLPPILLNALLLPLIWCLLDSANMTLYWTNVLSILISQSIILYALGIPILLLCKRNVLPLINKS
ncbi:MAG: QueT transporter family protein [Clostridia bacterium]|nr:QueT transporter family protein [Clostridia bacterium]